MTRGNLTTPSLPPRWANDVCNVHSMGSARFLKTVRARHQQGACVVKVFTKLDQSLNLKHFQRRLKLERDALIDCHNLLPYPRVIETERAGYLIRQWVASNLYDRIRYDSLSHSLPQLTWLTDNDVEVNSTRPFLTSIEKRWIAFQLLSGLADARERGVRLQLPPSSLSPLPPTNTYHLLLIKGRSRWYQNWKHPSNLLELDLPNRFLHLFQTHLPAPRWPLGILLFLRYVVSSILLPRTRTFLHLFLGSSEIEIDSRVWETRWEGYGRDGCVQCWMRVGGIVDGRN